MQNSEYFDEMARSWDDNQLMPMSRICRYTMALIRSGWSNTWSKQGIQFNKTFHEMR